jgi:hemoglobin
MTEPHQPKERTQPVYTPPGGPGQAERPSPEIFAALGEDGVFQLLEDFYVELGKSDARHLFPPTPEGLRKASERSAAFFVQLLGGPPLFIERYGPPRMRMRHFPFEIDEAARQEWLLCFRRVLENAEERYGFPAEHLAGFQAFLDGFSAWMVNVEPN